MKCRSERRVFQAGERAWAEDKIYRRTMIYIYIYIYRGRRREKGGNARNSGFLEPRVSK